MKRRHFNQFAISVATGLPTAILAQQAVQGEGRGYRQLTQPTTVEAGPDQIEVVDFFWYSCPHCNAFEPTLEAWIQKLPADVHLRRIPVAFRPDFAAQQRLYFTLEALGLADALHTKVFQAIHVERLPINRDDTILEWAKRQPGVDAARFAETYGSFAIANKVHRAKQIQNAYAVDSVPALGVAGRFYTDGELVQPMARALQVVDHLVGEIRRNRKS